MSFPQYGLECEPGGQPTPLGRTPNPDHVGCPGGSNTPGLIGGWTCPCVCHRDSLTDAMNRLVLVLRRAAGDDRTVVQGLHSLADSLTPPATDSHASVSPEQTPSPNPALSQAGDQCTVGETP